MTENTQKRIQRHLVAMYGAAIGEQVSNTLMERIVQFKRATPYLTTTAPELFHQSDIILITYGDILQGNQNAPLQNLLEFAKSYLQPSINTIHILPFFPYSSDDGFSIIDYSRVDPRLGTWADVERLGQDFKLMFDAVINHVSRESAWFQRFLAGDPAYADWFIAFEPGTPTDWVSQVVRPRALPLLTPVQTAAGEKLVWTTFSDDQIDLNYAHPPVLLAVIEILLRYVEKGARIIRLDAIAYLWKEIGTSCIHLPQTHRVVKLGRCVLDAVAPHTILITETNVPHAENISYFGDVQPSTGRPDEAQLVYQFPLPPLVLHSLLTGSARVLSEWAAGLSTPAGATFFNFTASHDGIGVMPARGLLTTAQIQRLVDATLAHGGLASYKTNADGSRSVYELNISYFDALSDPAGDEPLGVQVARFAASQAIMLALAGVPGIYVHSLLGSRSWRAGVAQTGRNRTINRQKFDRSTLERALADPGSLRHQVFAAYHRLLRARTADPAFHPLGRQRVLFLAEAVFALLRTAPAGDSHVLCLHNVSGRPQSISPSSALRGISSEAWRDLLSGEAYESDAGRLSLPPYAVRWLKL
ncbi:MAG: alpha-amylase family glycosyl hydrolase [Anaerolineales bacterium]